MKLSQWLSLSGRSYSAWSYVLTALSWPIIHFYSNKSIMISFVKLPPLKEINRLNWLQWCENKLKTNLLSYSFQYCAADNFAAVFHSLAKSITKCLAWVNFTNKQLFSYSMCNLAILFKNLCLLDIMFILPLYSHFLLYHFVLHHCSRRQMDTTYSVFCSSVF